MIQVPVSTAAPLHGVTIIPPLKTIPVVRALNPAHTGRVCSTWGDFHYKTFDGQVFRFPGLCNYVFSAHCGAAYEDFNIQLRRGRESNSTTLSRVTMKLDGLVVELTKSSVLVNNHPVQLPFSQSGVLIELSSGYLKVVARLGLVFMWNDDDSLLLELDTKYVNKTCGLCGDFNGSPESSEFLSHNVRLTPLEFGNLQKMDGPTEQCQDPLPVPQKNCSTRSGICEEILKSQLFSDCSALVDISSYLEACRQDVCLCESPDLSSCICHTLAEYSRQCAHAGGQPQDWRGPNLCSQTCPLNMQHQECGSPCVDTCSNPQRSQVCEDHCVAGCFCPEGMVLDDINRTGCVPVSQCACLYNGTSYASGTSYSTDCTKCTCSGGRWSCQELPCPGTCSVLGGSHFSTFDERQYTVHGDCSYVLSKPCDSNIFTVLAELRKCGLTDSETCLKSVTLSLGGGQTVVLVKATGEVFVNQIYTQLPVSTANVTLFRPSTFFVIAQTNLGLQLEVQLVPIMQVFVQLAPELRGLTCGLCGNFNSIQADDFQTISGVVEGTAAAFANTFKTQAACPNIKNIFEDPCSLSVENEKYAQHWCSRLTDASGPFSQCHTTVNPSTYFSNCMFDTCNCEKSEDCMCAALSSYVRACAAKGVLLSGWRDGVCTKPTTTCPKSMTYQYHISTCQPTCRALSEEDATCHVNFIPVDGCTCPEGTFLDDSGKCVQATSCPCYHRGSSVLNGESVHDSGAICTCTQGTLTCIGGPAPTPVCDAPMIYFDCRNATPGDTGAGCQKSCHTLDMTCYSSECVPGCVCPDGLVADGNGGCVVAEDCPCVHNEATYRPGETIRVGCNNCTCENRMWRCTDKPCLATCAVYGDGHYITFDGQRYSFNGNCEYTLLQDHCGGNGSSQDAFRVVTENIPCGTTGTTCSKDIKIFLGNYELKLSDGKVEVIQKGVGQEPPYYVHQMGIYLVVETDVGLVLLWDRKTSIFLRLSPEFKGRVCGLCGNFDDNAINDFTTRSQSVVGDVLEFGNSWKFSPSCPDAPVPKDPCTANPYRKSWAQKQCSIINSATFASCHAHVEPAKYYEACVSDACACDSGGDCECFCTAVAAYAQACHEVGVCVSWRTPDICPLFCDYYNPEGQCEWHYQPCGAPCMRTCQNPSGHCLHDLRGLEGCYPKCPPTAPIFDEGTMQCVSKCTVTPSPPPSRPCRVNGKLYRPGVTVPSDKNCYSCICMENGVNCTYDAGACVCTYNGQHYHPGEVIYHTTDGMGGCISAHCRTNGTIERNVDACSPTTPTPPTTFSFSTPVVMTSMSPSSTHPSPTLSTVYTESPSRAASTTSHMLSVKTSATVSTSTASTTASSLTTPGCHEECLWSPWMDVSRPGRGIDSGDFDTLENLRAHGYQICQVPRAVECRAEGTPELPLHALGQHVECSTTVGLTCHNKDQVSELCDNYQIRVQCCTPINCSTSSAPIHTTHLMTSTTSSTPVTPADHTDSTVISGPSTHAPGSSPTSSHPSASTPRPSNSAPVSSTTVKTTLPTTSPTPETTSGTSSVSILTSGSTIPSFETTHECKEELCSWTDWIDGSYPGPGRDSGDFDTFKNLRSKGYKFCEKPKNVECRAQFFPNTPLEELGQDITCNREEGLLCLNKNQLPPICYNYEIRIECCSVVDLCSTASATTHPTSHEVSTRTRTSWTKSLPSFTTKESHTHSTSTHTETWTTGSPHTVTEPGTTHCQPQCQWTKWFDTDFPVPGPHGGDLETYSNILRRGERICHRPEEITQLECRAENHPEVTLEDLGQVVQCDPTVGLVCRNQDQKDVSGMCLNYEVRVLCCRMPEGCPQTSVTPPVTSPDKPSFPVVSPSSVSPTLSSPTVHSTTSCYCSISGSLYPMGKCLGSIIYNQTDHDGHCYYALCNQDCQVVRMVSQDCPSTMPSPTPALSTSTSTTSPVTERHRCNVSPPRMKGETWHMPNCSQATCEGNNVVSLSPRQCPEMKAPSCANGYPPLKVDDKDGCCQHYQCQCVCSGWGDPHYITFDGTYYTFLDNCTYVLVQQIVPVFGHFRVLIDNYFCDLEGSVSCPQSIIVEYHHDRVVLTRRPVGGIMTNQIIFNNKVVSPGFQQNGIVISRVGIKMYVTIQEIGVQVMFSGLIFSVEVPFNTFANNTEGQCGTCTNDKKDECRLPGGAVTSSCSEMATQWKISNQPFCQGPPPTSTSVVPSPSPTLCPPSPICQLILSKVFQPCHDIISPLPFYEGCLFDYCHGSNLEVICSGLELYASLCASYGRCIPWRSQTNNTCSLTCPDKTVYQACGPSNPHYCLRNDDISTSLILQEAGPFTEGCFCPAGMTLYSTNDSTCMPSCQWCLGPHGELVEPGHSISTGCQDCICKDAKLTCQRKSCPQTCPEPGFVPVPEALEAGQCCPQFSCAVCNSSYCPPPLHCPENSSLMVTYEEGACCPRQNCTNRRKGCEVNGIHYQPGAVVSSSLCETCLCQAPSNPHSDVFVVSCKTEVCRNSQCPKGSEYQVKPGQCCGECVQKACPFKSNNNSTYLYRPGESWPEPGNPCMTHKCEKFRDVLTIVTMKMECPKINCPPGQARLREDGCCYDCFILPQQKCTVHQRQQIIRQENCSSEEPVSLAYCQGNCGDSTSMYSLEANIVEHKCECCQELQTSQRNVTLRCDDGSSRIFSYTQVEECGCLGQRCYAPGDASHSEPAESEFMSKGSNEHSQQLPAANVTIFNPSSFFIMVQTGMGLQLQVQLVPIMQVFVRLDPSYHGQMCGLCGNFNQNQADDFTALSGVVEGTGAAFSNMWKTQASCPNSKNTFEDPCSYSVETENYAQKWCSMLTESSGVFSACHATVSPAPFYSNCMFDTCNCEKSEDCMCAALSSYVRACAAKGVLLSGWRDSVCSKYMNNCPKTKSYSYAVSTCEPTCRSLSEVDVTCGISFVPVDGCTCPEGTFLNDKGNCVREEECSCFFHGTVVAPGEFVMDNGVACSCENGKLICLGALMQRSTECQAPMVYLDCKNASVGDQGAECLRSCHTLDVDCFSTQCVSGCVCPLGLVSDGNGGCIAEEDCPCIHNEATYKPGEIIRVDCNNCTCRNRRWECTEQPCMGACVAYGDGHFVTFDGERYIFEGSCEYTLAQDYCGANSSTDGSFRIVTENVPCGTTGTTCSKAIKIFVESYELILHEGNFKVVERGPSGELPYKIRYMGIFLVIEIRSGIVVSWDRKTSVFVRLQQHYKGRVCGLCGNFDDNAINDFTTRSQSVVGDVLEFGNSWKFSPSCPDAPVPKDPCTANPYRKSWAQKKCSIINSATFAACHSQVDSTKYYEACMHDVCACDSGGDCECFCTAVAAYAQACRDVGVCLSWRTPDICPLFCDYYNPHGECEWHYQACGAPCLKTCRNPDGQCLVDLPGLEGCYPQCPSSQPFFNEDQMKCVAQCGCYDNDGNYHDIGTQVPTAENCQSCLCTPSGLECVHNLTACTCTYEDRTYHYNDVIYNTTDGLGACLVAICKDNGTIIRTAEECPEVLSTTPFTFTASSASPATTGSGPTVSTVSTVCVREVCHWSMWYDESHPEPGMTGGDFETFENLRRKGHQVCQTPAAIECRAEKFPSMDIQNLGQKVTCDQSWGLKCFNSEQNPPLCYNYEIRVLCCEYVPCSTSQTSSATTTHSQPDISRERSLPTLTHGKHPTWTTIVKETTLHTTLSSQPKSIFTSQTRATSTASSPMTSTTCQPQCQWTKWIDTDYPTSDKEGGDIETYDRIRTTGAEICEQPRDIQCVAQNYIDMSLDMLDQKVKCDVNFGLVCHNRDQEEGFGMCYNYMIRVLCCDVSHCQGPTTTAGSSLPWSTHSPLVPFTTTVSSSTLSSFQTKHPSSSSVSSTQASTWTTFSVTGCVPQCAWTDWFDADFPNPGPRGGDFEVYAVLREVGFVFCDKPIDIQCRSEKEPDRPLETLEQVVQCDVRFGLICKNINQTGPLQYCDNYHVRFLCCDSISHCTTSPITTPSTVPSTSPLSLVPPSSSLVPTHSSPVLTTETSPVTTGLTVAPSSTSVNTYTPEVSPSSQVTFSMSTASPLSLSTLRPTVFSSQSISPSPCFCRAFGELFLPGDVIYNKTDGAGCQLFAICNQYCDVDRFQGACPSSSSPVPSTPTSLSPLPPGCDNAVPPRQVNESWTLENCTVARCQGNNQIILLEPEPVANVTCVNKHLPIKVWDQEPCHFHYECECFCSGWGPSHYLTFDGTSYTFPDNCTSVLMREIHPRHGNLSILAHSYYCGATTSVTFCPRALSVYYNSMEIILTITTTDSGKEEGLIIWDQVWIRSSFSKNGVTVSLSGTTTMTVNISTIGTSITFDGHIFQIWLPYRYFSNNTEGQCGTCTNSQTDDCRRPDGTIASNCQDMAKDWLVPGNNSCLVQPSPSPSTTALPPVSSTPFSTTCPTAPLCELMLSQVFAECHKLISPDAFFSSCVNDHCNANVTSMLCQSLEAYATLCQARGVCTDWRSATGGLCDLSCPPTKEYRPCGPLHPLSCSSRSLNVSTEILVEGCFCPENQLLFNSRMDICVLECPCVGPDGLPKFPGEYWISNCQSCVCDPSSVSVHCKPVQCESEQELPPCTKAGFVTVTRPKADNPCCSETVCVCDTSTCPKSLPKCEPGQELIRTHEEGSCCPASSCRPMMCSYNDTLYGIGANFPGVGHCQTCTCFSVGNQEPKVECREILCTTSCPQGFKYILVPEQCCGKCVQNACLTPEGQAVEPNEIWVNTLVDNCTLYSCVSDNGIHVLTPIPTSCPDVSNCRGTLRKEGCCYSCEKEDSNTCEVHVNTTILRHKGCETEVAVNITFCEGSCSGMSKYSMEAQAMEHQCTCCQESKVHDVAVAMQCPNGIVIQHTYTHIDECSCAPTCSSLPMTSLNTP
ncbi:mucin-5AC [Sigmodon hispidus]